MIKLTNIHKEFSDDILKKKKIVLNDVTFSIEESSITGFLGVNGAGKTTCIKLIMDFIKPNSGTISFEKISRSEIGFLPERPYYYHYLTGNEFLSFMGSLSGLNRADLKLNAKYWTERLGIDHALSKKLKDYSKGMLQRMGLVSALIHKPKLLILDEPLSGLDPIGRKDFKDAFLEIKKMGTAIFLSSHILPEMEQMCDRIVYLKNGVIDFDGPIQSLVSESKEKSIINLWGPFGKLDSSYLIETRIDENRGAIIVDNTQIPECLNKLWGEGFNVISLEPYRHSLEEIFYSNEKKGRQ